jgi:hypothetical protein
MGGAWLEHAASCLFRRTDTASTPNLTAMRSSILSPFRSAIATAAGWICGRKRRSTRNVPPPLFVSTMTPLDPTFETARSGLLSRVRFPIATPPDTSSSVPVGNFRAARKLPWPRFMSTEMFGSSEFATARSGFRSPFKSRSRPTRDFVQCGSSSSRQTTAPRWRRTPRLRTWSSLRPGHRRGRRSRRQSTRPPVCTALREPTHHVFPSKSLPVCGIASRTTTTHPA